VFDGAESIAGTEAVVALVTVMVHFIGVYVGRKFKVVLGHGEPFRKTKRRAARPKEGRGSRT
jgi:hypothetical protein